MEKYTLIKKIGGGSFGSVWEAITKQSGEVVAIKLLKYKYYSWEECLNMKEVKCLRKLNNHSNIVKLKEFVRENNTLYFVFEYMDCSLETFLIDRSQFIIKQYFSEAEVRNWCFQILQGLNYMHQQGYFHRDLTPRNLLVSNDIIKVACFDSCSQSPEYSEYITTIQYRAPEMLLRSGQCSSKVDMWAMGVIMAELIALRSLFPPTSLFLGASDNDQLNNICKTIGSPTADTWPGGFDLANAIGYRFPKSEGINLSKLIPLATEDEMSLIQSLLSWDSCKRPTAAEALQHPLFHDGWFHVPRPLNGDSAAAADENLASMTIDSCKLTPPSGMQSKSMSQDVLALFYVIVLVCCLICYMIVKDVTDKEN